MRYPQLFLEDKEIFKGEGIVASQKHTVMGTSV
jgi:hypothetical protein